MQNNFRKTPEPTLNDKGEVCVGVGWGGGGGGGGGALRVKLLCVKENIKYMARALCPNHSWYRLDTDARENEYERSTTWFSY